MDAEVPSALQLTRKVHEHLARTDFEDARLYGYVLAKLITNRARKGVSPFAEVGIEDVYATLKRFLSRRDDVLSEFVQSWDNYDAIMDFDPAKFHQELSSFVARMTKGDLRFARASEGPGAYLRSTLAYNPSIDQQPETRLRPFTDALIECLQPNTDNDPYMQEIAERCDNHFEMVASLNYDKVFERACEEKAIGLDFGLSQWEEKKIVRFHGKTLRFAKLHGSVDWYIDGDEVRIDDSRRRWQKRGMVFGAQSEKLVADGPYLQLRSAFEKSLRSTNKLGVIGYSFQDSHVNSLIRIWLTTKRRAKLVVLDPSEVHGIPHLFGVAGSTYWEKVANQVDFVHVRGTTERRVSDFVSEVLGEPNFDREQRNRFGFRVV